MMFMKEEVRKGRRAIENGKLKIKVKGLHYPHEAGLSKLLIFSLSQKQSSGMLRSTSGK